MGKCIITQFSSIDECCQGNPKGKISDCTSYSVSLHMSYFTSLLIGNQIVWCDFSQETQINFDLCKSIDYFCSAGDFACWPSALPLSHIYRCWSVLYQQIILIFSRCSFEPIYKMVPYLINEWQDLTCSFYIYVYHDFIP